MESGVMDLNEEAVINCYVIIIWALSLNLNSCGQFGQINNHFQYVMCFLYLQNYFYLIKKKYTILAFESLIGYDKLSIKSIIGIYV